MNVVDLARGIGRLVHPKTIKREFPIALRMAIQSFSDSLPKEYEYRHTAIFTQGFYAIEQYYIRFLSELLGHGILLRSPQGLGVNRISWEAARRILKDEIKRTTDTTGEPCDLVGHSKGALDSIGVAMECPNEVRKLVLVAAPFRGGSFKGLCAYMELIYREPGIPVHAEDLPSELLAKITNILTVSDLIVPKEEATLPGAHEEIIINEEACASNNHAGLCYHVRDIIVSCIQSPVITH